MNVYNSLRYLGLWFNIITLSCSAPITSHVVTSIKWAHNMPGSMHWRSWNLVGFLSISIKHLGWSCCKKQASCCLAKNYGMSNLHSWRCNSLMKKTEERIPYWEAERRVSVSTEDWVQNLYRYNISFYEHFNANFKGDINNQIWIWSYNWDSILRTHPNSSIIFNIVIPWQTLTLIILFPKMLKIFVK